MPRGLTFSRKTGLAFAATVLVAVCVTGVSAYALELVLATRQRVALQHDRDVLSAHRLDAAAEREAASGLGFLLTGDDRYLYTVHVARAEFASVLDDLQARVSAGVGSSQLARIEQLKKRHETAIDHAIDPKRHDAPSGAATDLFEREVRPLSPVLGQSLQNFGEHVRAALDEARATSMLATSRAFALIAVVAGAALLLASILAWLFTRTLSRLYREARGAADALQRERDFIEAVLQTVGALVIVLDGEGRIVRFNRTCEKVTGYQSTDVRGKMFWDVLLAPEDVRPVQSVFWQLRHGFEPRNEFENDWVARDGSRRRIAWSNTTLAAADGSVGYVIGTGIDITERERAYRRARDAVELVGIAAHELRSPLTALALNVQRMARWVARRTPEAPAPVLVEGLRSADRQVGRLDKLVGELLDFTRLTSGRLRLDLEDVELGGLVREVAARFDEELERLGSVLSLSTHERVVGRWDRLRLEQVVSNLLSNAIKYGARAPIEITVDRAGELGRLSVRDHGMGIPSEDQARIFERFERAVEERRVVGTGLGLWIVRQIVVALGGEVEVWSEPGQGALFTVKLPLRPAEADRSESRHLGEPASEGEAAPP